MDSDFSNYLYKEQMIPPNTFLFDVYFVQLDQALFLKLRQILKLPRDPYHFFFFAPVVAARFGNSLILFAPNMFRPGASAIKEIQRH